jgi:hypothetical protein
MRPTLAKVPPRQTAPVEPLVPPAECPRCGESLERDLREVNLTITLDDGAQASVVGFECARCGWCCLPEC